MKKKEEALLKIKPPNIESYVKKTFKLSASSVKKLELYSKAFNATYNTEVAADVVLDEILKNFFSSDQAFKKYLRDEEESKRKEAQQEAGEAD